MNDEAVTILHKSVMCIFCGSRTPVRSESDAKQAFVPIFHSGLSLIRCTSCGKEAQYQTKEIVGAYARAS